MTYDEMDIDQSRAVLDELLAEFPFADREGRSKSVQIAAMLSLFCQKLMPPKSQTPIFLYTANSPRSGKTLLAKMAVIPMHGACSLQTLGNDEEELRKLLDSCAIDGAPYLFIDNVRRKITSAALEAFATAGTWSGRVLGKSGTFLREKQTVIFITANQAKISPDLSGRALFVDLWLSEADPQRRKISHVIDDAYLSRMDIRKRILSALWGLIRHWDASGRPGSEFRLGGFEQWCKVVAGIVVAAGYGDPVRPAELDMAGDPESQDIKELVRLLVDMEQPEGGFTFPAVVDLCVEKNLFEDIMMEGRWVRPKEAADYYDLSAKGKSRFGKLLTAYDGRVFRYEDGTSIRFGKRGKNRQRRYEVAMEVTG
jgi:hypothetical protein